MGSPVTFSGFNKIDFGMILDAVMTQESQPLVALETQQKALETRATTYRNLASRITAFQTAVEALAGNSSITGRTTANTDTTTLTASASGTAAPGIYDIEVLDLARAQVTAATSFPPDPDQTVVAWGGALTIGGVAVSVDAPLTLQGLADRINSTDDVPVTASVIRASGTSWQLVLTGKATGVAGQFDIQNTLQGPAPALGGITFADTDGDGVSGNSAADNAVSASDARALINSVTVTSTTNTIADAIPGVTLSLLRRSEAGKPATLTVSEDLSDTKARLQKLTESFNDIIKFAEDQQQAAARGESTSIARDPLLRGLRSALSHGLGAEYSAGGPLASLSTIGVEFDRTGRLTFNKATFDDKAGDYLNDIRKLFTAQGTEADQGVFTRLQAVLKSYTDADGLLKTMQDRIKDQSSTLGRRIGDLEARLIQRRATLQKEYIAADMAMSRMNADIASLGQIGGQYRLF